MNAGTNQPKSAHQPSARALALRLIGQVKGQRRSVEETCRRHPDFMRLDPRDQSLCRALVTHTFRHHHALDAVFTAHLSRPLESLSPAALGPLRLGLVELLVLKNTAHAALNETVKLAPKSLKGLVNAVLRKVAQDADAPAQFWAATAVPDWLAEKWAQDFGAARARRIQQGLRQLPEMDLSFKAAMPSLGVQTLPHQARVPAGDPRGLPGFSDGDWWVQDISASLPVRMLGPVAGLRVLDVCAAPGGKTLQLAAAGAQVTALDASKARVKRLRENLHRTHLKAEVVIADALEWLPPGALYDAIVLDAPCSASGTLRRHPEWPWIHARKDQLQYVDMQARLLDRALTWLRPGGKLVYAVCSLFKEEGEAQMTGRPYIRAQPGSIPDWAWDEKKGWLRTTPDPEINRDGFFAALFQKT